MNIVKHAHSISLGELPKTMEAVVAYAPGDYRFTTVETPRTGPDEIIIKVEGCGICAGDIKSYDGAPSFWGDKDQPAYKKFVQAYQSDSVKKFIADKYHGTIEPAWD